MPGLLMTIPFLTGDWKSQEQQVPKGKWVVGEGNPNQCSYWGTSFRESTCERGLPKAQAGAHTSLGQEVSLWHAKSQEISFRSFPAREVSYFACKVCVFLYEMEFFCFFMQFSDNLFWFIIHGHFSSPGGAQGEDSGAALVKRLWPGHSRCLGGSITVVGQCFTLPVKDDAV